jgi:pimeloyl-ACP methyl ester carboxylesterase
MAQRPSLRVLRRDPVPPGPDPGRVALLVHGSMDRGTSFTRLMGRLLAWTIVTYDRRGYAGSASTGPPLCFDDQVGDLIDVLAGQPAVVFGHSYGGDVALAAAVAHPALIPGAVVWEPPLPWLPGWPASGLPGPTDIEAEDRAERFMRGTVGDRIWERLPARTRAQRRAEGPTLCAEIASLSRGPAFDPATIEIPVVVGRGGCSPVYMRRAARELASALPKGELADIDEAGHGAHLSHPAQVAALIERVAVTCLPR